MSLKWRDIKTINEAKELEHVLLKYRINFMAKMSYQVAVKIKNSRGSYFHTSDGSKLEPYFIKTEFDEWAYIEGDT